MVASGKMRFWNYRSLQNLFEGKSEMFCSDPKVVILLSKVVMLVSTPFVFLFLQSRIQVTGVHHGTKRMCSHTSIVKQCLTLNQVSKAKGSCFPLASMGFSEPHRSSIVGAEGSEWPFLPKSNSFFPLYKAFGALGFGVGMGWRGENDQQWLTTAYVAWLECCKGGISLYFQHAFSFFYDWGVL